MIDIVDTIETPDGFIPIPQRPYITDDELIPTPISQFMRERREKDWKRDRAWRASLPPKRQPGEAEIVRDMWCWVDLSELGL